MALLLTQEALEGNRPSPSPAQSPGFAGVTNFGTFYGFIKYKDRFNRAQIERFKTASIINRLLIIIYG